MVQYRWGCKQTGHLPRPTGVDGEVAALSSAGGDLYGFKFNGLTLSKDSHFGPANCYDVLTIQTKPDVAAAKRSYLKTKLFVSAKSMTQSVRQFSKTRHSSSELSYVLRGAGHA